MWWPLHWLSELWQILVGTKAASGPQASFFSTTCHPASHKLPESGITDTENIAWPYCFNLQHFFSSPAAQRHINLQRFDPIGQSHNGGLSLSAQAQRHMHQVVNFAAFLHFYLLRLVFLHCHWFLRRSGIMGGSRGSYSARWVLPLDSVDCFPWDAFGRLCLL